MTFTRSAASAASALLLALALTACGDDSDGGSGGDSGGSGGGFSGPPDDASVADFCEAYNDESVYEDLDFENPDEQQFVDALQEFADNLAEVGTPEDIPEDAREGFEIGLQQIEDIEAEDIDFESQEDPFEEGLSEEDKDKVDAFEQYAGETCGDEGSEDSTPESE